MHAVLDVRGGTSRRFLYTSGCLLYGATGDTPATEDATLHPLNIVRFRQGLEGAILAASEGAGAEGRVEPWPLDQARQALWGFADAIACDQIISGRLAVREWRLRPSRHSILDELRAYASAPA